MLVLSRYKNQDIVIDTSDGQIVIKVVDIETYKVRIGIEAPQQIQIMRRELLKEGNIAS